MKVAIRELKSKLSSYLKQASAGELITVTDRRPIAILGPVLDKVDLDSAVEEGWVSGATTSGLEPVRRYHSQSSIDRVIAEDRAE